ncbi:hypothetical protein ACOME3_004785 [Neoechinorhynchus agilis]
MRESGSMALLCKIEFPVFPLTSWPPQASVFKPENVKCIDDFMEGRIRTFSKKSGDKPNIIFAHSRFGIPVEYKTRIELEFLAHSIGILVTVLNKYLI